jgi:hypothetical protein
MQSCIDAYRRVISANVDVELTAVAHYSSRNHTVGQHAHVVLTAPGELQLKYSDTNKQLVEIYCRQNYALDKRYSEAGEDRETTALVLGRHQGISNGISTFLPAILLDLEWGDAAPYSRSTRILESLRETCRYVSKEELNGRVCDKVLGYLEVPDRQSIEFTLWIDDESHLICKLKEFDPNGGGFSGKIVSREVDQVFKYQDVKLTANGKE